MRAAHVVFDWFCGERTSRCIFLLMWLFANRSVAEALNVLAENSAFFGKPLVSSATSGVDYNTVDNGSREGCM